MNQKTVGGNIRRKLELLSIQQEAVRLLSVYSFHNLAVYFHLVPGAELSADQPAHVPRLFIDFLNPLEQFNDRLHHRKNLNYSSNLYLIA